MVFPPVHLGQFAGEILVACPRCSGRAHLRPFEPTGDRGYRLVCPRCGRVKDWLLRRDGSTPAPWCGPRLAGFDLDLWLQVPCSGEVLWAYNAAHLDFLAAFIAAPLRERPWLPGNSSLNSRLPRWMTAASHREAVLKGIATLRGRCGELA